MAVLTRVVPVLLVSVALALGGCSGDEPADQAPRGSTSPTSPTGPTSEGTADPAVLAGVAALFAGTNPSPEEASEADCFATELTSRLSTDELSAAGILDPSGQVTTSVGALDEPTAQAWVAAQNACADFVEVSTRAVGAQSKGKVDATSYADCLRAAIDPATIDAALVATLTGAFDAPEVTVLAESQADCVKSASPPE